MHDLFWRQRTGALGLVRGYGTNCMRERGPARVRIGYARSPGSRASIDRPVAGRRWQSARTLHPRGQAHREKGPVRAEGAGAHLWDHQPCDHLQRPRRPPSGQPEGVGCRPEVPAKHRQTTNLALEAVVAVGSRVGGMETVVVHAADAAEPCSAAHELRWGCAPLKSAPRKP